MLHLRQPAAQTGITDPRPRARQKHPETNNHLLINSTLKTHKEHTRRVGRCQPCFLTIPRNSSHRKNGSCATRAGTAAPRISTHSSVPGCAQDGST